jgi:hypothetical protein
MDLPDDGRKPPARETLVQPSRTLVQLKRRRQALVIIEDEDGIITVMHFGKAPTVVIQHLIEMGATHVVGPEMTVTDADKIIGHQIEVEGPASLVMAHDFRTAWDFSTGYWQPPADDPASPPARGELGR